MSTHTTLRCSVVAFGLSIVLSCAASAALLTVGPGGSFGEIQPALDAAMASPETDEIRLQAGTFVENLHLDLAHQGLSISGGWTSDFTLASGRTVIDGNLAERVLRLTLDHATLTLERLELAHGATTTGGAALFATVASSLLVLDSSVVRDNLTQADPEVSAEGAVALRWSGGSTVALIKSTFQRNRGQGGSPSGGAVSLQESTSEGPASSISIEACSFLDNVLAAEEGSQATGSALFLNVRATQARVFDNLFRRNAFEGDGLSAGTGAALWAGGNATIEARRNRFFDQRSADSAEQLSLSASGTARIIMGDSEIARGNGFEPVDGIAVSARDTARVQLVNLTVVDNSGQGIKFFTRDASNVSLANSIVVGHSTDTAVTGTVRSVRNLIGLDPSFVQRTNGNYRLRSNSRARNAGSNNPPGGLGSLDAARRPRLRGSAVDQGAYEVQ